ncbi:MAG: flavin reductase family protein [Clostridiales Family XIII bacterium]|jgi:flavin reductase (DIM6/NTAB) family NADH-FMN oxidoreductase RutF|nr:flavin reductase family protein [Clostridiales Family XIII bacterium]
MKKSIGIRETIFPNPVMILGTYDKDGVPDAAAFAWGGIASSGPEAISVAVRPSRYTHENLMLKKAFTINLPSPEYVEESDYFGIVSGRDVNKFERTGLTPVKGDFVDAPYIEEFPVNIECALAHTLDLGAHTLFIGEVKDIKIDEALQTDVKGLWSATRILTYDSLALSYRLPGEEIAKAFSCGLKFK